MKVVLMIDALPKYGSPLLSYEVLGGFASIADEPDDPKVYISLAGTMLEARQKKRGFLQILMEFIDHETVHIMAFLSERDGLAGWNEEFAERFELAGNWARMPRHGSRSVEVQRFISSRRVSSSGDMTKASNTTGPMVRQ